ncbi:MAG: UDP-N-acetylmuramate dehydrogenase [Spirochaetales bacterium]|nr:UDP-N-acetylmuramate dehydrogenase [Spirochaetales bacterium]
MQHLISVCSDSSVSFYPDFPLAEHTSFKIGGPADIFVVPKSRDQLQIVLHTCRTNHIPVFILGGGANIIVSDKGIRGCVISMSEFSGLSIHESIVTAGAGLTMSFAAEQSAAAALQGLEMFYSMPGSVGGSVWMNARCYGISISDTLHSVTTIDTRGEITTSPINPVQFDYKKTPFQKSREIIIEACFSLSPGNTEILKKLMAEKHQDRKKKGHFDYPSAGSIFKNNRAFNEPTGKIIDSLGLRGYAIGGAQISPKHANIIINTGKATADDVLSLIAFVKAKVKKTCGFCLEEEVIPVGEF